MTDSQTLLAQYARNGSESAFRELVTRYLGLVYSTALRLVGGDTHLAEDVAQTVFTDLSRNARNLSSGVMLGGWLHQRTFNVAAPMMRAARRRQSREREAVQMSAISDHSTADFEQIAPLLDEALTKLGKDDRTAILLRFFEEHDFRSVGQALGINEDAARMRVNRALEKLEVLLKRRGVTTSAAALSVVLTANAVQAAPVGLAVTISTAAAMGGTTIAATTTATAIKTIAMTAMQKTLITATILVSVTTPLLIHSHARTRVREQEQTLKQQAEQMAELRAENDRFSNQLAQAKSSQPATNDEFREVLRLRGQVGLLRNEIQASGQPKPAASLTREEKLAAMASYYSERARRLKSAFEANPAAKTPELQFLSEKFWLGSSPDPMETDEDLRVAMSNMRGHAWNTFAHNTLYPAMQEYAKHHNQQSPTDISQLKPYFESPVDDAILERWAIAPASSLAKDLQTGDDWLLTQKSPVDGEMDQRLACGLKGFRWGNRRANHW